MLSSAQMEFNAILHAGLRDSSVDLGEHSRLNISRNHTAGGTNHSGQGYREWARTAAKLNHRESRRNQAAEEFLGLVQPAS